MARNKIDKKINKALAGFTTAVTGLTQACQALEKEKQDLIKLNDSRDNTIEQIRAETEARIISINEAKDATLLEAGQCQADTDRLTRVAQKIQDLLS